MAAGAHATVHHWDVGSGGNGHYYEPVAQSINWAGASAAAALRGGYLVTLTSAEENAYVHGLVQNDAALWFNDAAGPWIGAFQPDGSPEPAGGWSWVSGEPWGYTNWWPSQPDNAGGREHYAHFDGPNYGATWNDQRATQFLNGYVVEYNFDPGDLGTCVPNWGATVFSDDYESTAFPGKYGDRYICAPVYGHTFSVVGTGTNHRLRHTGGTAWGGGNGQLFVRDFGNVPVQVGGWMYARARIFNVAALHPGRWFGVGVRVDTVTGAGYYAQVSVNGVLQLVRNNNWDDCRVLTSVRIPPIATGDSIVVSLKLEAGPNGTQALSCCLNGQPAATTYLECAQLAAGSAALFASAGTTEFDDFIVISNVPPLDAALPTSGPLGLRVSPSPASNGVRMDFSIAPGAAGRATLRVLDVAGAHVRTLDLGRRDVGPHSAMWDGRADNGERVRPGTYFCRLVVDGRPVADARAVFLR